MKQQKHDFEPGDIVSYKTSNGKTDYLIVIAFMNDIILGRKCSEENSKPFLIRSSLVTYCPMVKIEKEKLRAFFRCEMSLRKMTGNIRPFDRLSCDEPYAVTLSDMLAALKHGQEVGIIQFVKEWFHYVSYEFPHLYNIGESENGESINSGYRFLPTESDYVYEIYNELTDWIVEDTQDMDILDDLVEKTEKLIQKNGISVPQRFYNEDEKITFIESLNLSHNMLTASDEEITLFRNIVEELCRKGNKTAMRIKAFSCYGGNRAYETDWVQARDLLLALMDREDVEFIANALGYIYYYGRCNEGVPEYEKAFYYFSIGAAGGMIESKYKISDMFFHGYAVPKNIRIASDMIDILYSQTLQFLLNGILLSKHPDVAFRKGNILLSEQHKPDVVFYYYLQAEFAIRMRMLEEDFYGDKAVAENIRNAIREILPKTSFKKPKYTISKKTLEYFLRNSFSDESTLIMELTLNSDGQYKAVIKIQPDHYGDPSPKLFLTIPEAHFCGYKDNLTLHSTSVRSIQVEGKEHLDRRTIIPFNGVKDNMLLFNGNVIAEIDADWKLTLTNPERMKRHQFISVCFPDSVQCYNYLCEFPGVKIGQKIPIYIEDDCFDATVVEITERTDSEMPLHASEYRKIVLETGFEWLNKLR